MSCTDDRAGHRRLLRRIEGALIGMPVGWDFLLGAARIQRSLPLHTELSMTSKEWKMIIDDQEVTGLPDMIKVGTWRSREGNTFAVCHGRRPAIVIDLVGSIYNRLVVTLDDPEHAMRLLT